jgi:hypothetical protein
MKFDEYGLLCMEHDTTVEASVGDACAETGRYWILKLYTKSKTLTEEISGKVSTAGVEDYFKNTEGLFGYIRHPRAKASWGFGPDQWTPRFILSVIDDFRVSDMRWQFDQTYMPIHPMVLAALYPRALFPLFSVLQEIKLLMFPSGDCLNWFMMVLFTGHLPKILTKKKFLAMVYMYYKPETDIGAWTFVDLYEKAADMVFDE